ncbi:MAG TPA: ABC transporter ATP-binding protein [Candidatus Nanoarchaeia archaeon]|nr:ABC transporter ATP-binding protein [Candidatus Nanoarchaeia archaeon]
MNDIITVKNVNKHFGGVYAVQNCSLEVKKGTITSIIGPNGAGKTTLFNIICGLYKPDQGTITFNGKDITGVPCYKIGQLGVSRTFQQAKLFKNMTVKDNLLVAREASDEEIQHALNSVRFPLSMETKASELSYGQTRLVEIARAVFKPHKLLMLDEPTAGVNPKVRHELKQILLDLKKKGNTILLIEHDMEFVMSISDEVIVMNQGTVLTHGTPEKVQKDKRVLEAYLGQ